MTDHIMRTISDIEQEVQALETELFEKKQLVNQLCDHAKQPRRYPDVQKAESATRFDIRSDQFFGKALATAAREYLTMRKALNQGAATPDEIFKTLESGGFVFEGKHALRNLSISLSKNTQTFMRLPNGTFGLAEWYPNVKAQKQSKTNSDASDEISNGKGGDNEKSIGTEEE